MKLIHSISDTDVVPESNLELGEVTSAGLPTYYDQERSSSGGDSDHGFQHESALQRSNICSDISAVASGILILLPDYSNDSIIDTSRHYTYSGAKAN